MIDPIEFGKEIGVSIKAYFARAIAPVLERLAVVEAR